MPTNLAPLPPFPDGAPATIAFYLPQYHRIPENDTWWGEGFTDWVNVSAARPIFPGHALPNLPGELGAYDPLSRDVRAAQGELARAYGVYGFCYYFYWFGGRRLLERPLERMLADGQPDLPFCLCWANEPWTRRWDGRDSDVLMPQHHDRTGDLAILDDLMPYLEDPRYIRVDGRPLLLVYRPGLMPDAAGFAWDLRMEAVRRGVPGLYLCNVLSIGDKDRRMEGYDAAVAFPPNGTLGVEVSGRRLGADLAFRGRIFDYSSTVQTALAQPAPRTRTYPGVMPRWDNTARKGDRAHIFHGSTPGLFERWLWHAAELARRQDPTVPLVFVNSWNEWAEGAHLEPDQRTGRAYLAAVRRVVGVEGWGPSESEYEGLAIAPGDPPSAGVGVREEEEEVALSPGLPDRISEGEDSRGTAWIAAVDDRPFDGRLIRARTGRSLRLRGWFLQQGRRSPLRRGRGFIVLSAGSTAWHAPLTHRHMLPDVVRSTLVRARRTRWLVHGMDALPRPVAALPLAIGAGISGRPGFDTRFVFAGVSPGTYRLGFCEASASGCQMVPTAYELSVEDDLDD